MSEQVANPNESVSWNDVPTSCDQVIRCLQHHIRHDNKYKIYFSNSLYHKMASIFSLLQKICCICLTTEFVYFMLGVIKKIIIFFLLNSLQVCEQVDVCSVIFRIIKNLSRKTNLVFSSALLFLCLEKLYGCDI